MTKTAQIATAALGRRVVAESGRQAPRRGKGRSLAAVNPKQGIHIPHRSHGSSMGDKRSVVSRGQARRAATDGEYMRGGEHDPVSQSHRLPVGHAAARSTTQEHRV